MFEDVEEDCREDSGGSRGEEEAEQEGDTVSGNTRTKRDNSYELAASVMQDQSEKYPQEHKLRQEMTRSCRSKQRS